MKHFISLMMAIILVISAMTLSVSAEENLGRTDDMESYELYRTFGANLNPCGDYCNFGGGSEALVASNAVANSGKQSLCLFNRCHTLASFKFNNLFTRTLTKEDVGRSFKISFLVYADKNAGVYKNSPGSMAKVEAFTADELAKSTGTVFTILPSGGDGQQYTHRHGTADAMDAEYANKKFAVKWNEWSEVSFVYTVKEAYLDNGSTEKGMNPSITGFKFFQDGIDFSINEGLANTFYVDDLKVEEITAPAAETTAAPVVTTAAPAVTTAAPAVTTAAPAATTAAPASTPATADMSLTVVFACMTLSLAACVLVRQKKSNQ